MGIIKNIPPDDIEVESFEIIEREFFHRTGREPDEFDEHEFQVIRRVIHATGDFSFADTLVFHEHAVSEGIAALRSGKDISIDVGMGAAGINRHILKKFGGELRCHIGDVDVAERARSTRQTRSETAVEKLVGRRLGILAVGNAPTALIKALAMIDNNELAPALVVGVPVGFVNAEESKELLARQSFPFITNKGRKGGSPVAVAIVNALLKIAETSNM